MKIQKHLSGKKGDKVYYKYVIVIPKELIKKAGLKEGDELEGEVVENKITIKRI